MGFDAFDEFFVHGRAVACRAKGSVRTKPSCAPCDLSRFHRRQITPPAAVIFCEARKGDMFRIKV